MLSVRRASPAGGGALAILALEGELPHGLLDRGAAWPAPGSATVCRLLADGKVLDEVVVLGRPGGAELHLHGGVALVEGAIALLVARGAVLTHPVAPLVPASLPAARCLASHAKGPLADLRAECERARENGRVPLELARRARESRERARLGRMLMVPPVVRLVGRPNAGKSTLFNALLGRRRALISPRRGTTRDTVSAQLLVCDVPVVLEDTAGREDFPETRPRDADLVVHLLSEGDRPGPGNEPTLIEVQGRADLHPRGRGVSGLTGIGVEALLECIGERLGLRVEPDDHALAPVAPDLIALLDQVLAMPMAEPA